MNINWDNTRAVILDVDGTLYSQAKLRYLIYFELFRYYFLQPQRWMDLIILYKFRQLREKLAENRTNNITHEQYRVVAEKLAVPIDRVRLIIRTWLHEKPIKHLHKCKFKHLQDFIDQVKLQNILIGVLSDYPAQTKLLALGIKADAVVTAEDSDVNMLKPAEIGAQKLISILNVQPDQIIYIGDRQVRDGECAKKVGIRYLNKSNISQGNSFNCYSIITNQLIKMDTAKHA